MGIEIDVEKRIRLQDDLRRRLVGAMAGWAEHHMRHGPKCSPDEVALSTFLDLAATCASLLGVPPRELADMLGSLAQAMADAAAGAPAGQQVHMLKVDSRGRGFALLRR